jgi:hypothetical protein
VWAKAGKELAEASRLAVIGFSLAATDEFFRRLFEVADNKYNPAGALCGRRPQQGFHGKNRDLY